MADHYQLLNVSPTASADQIQAAYHRERARLLASAAEDETRIAPALASLEQAFVVLSDAAQRAAYDQSRSQTGTTALTVANIPSALQTSNQAPTRPIEQRVCPHCGSLNPAQATLCANCGKQISRRCPKCGNPVALVERVCGRCGTVIAEYDQNRFAQSVALEKQIQDERRVSEVRVSALEATHRANRRFGFIFWAIVFALLIGVCVLGSILLSASGR
jgi:ribosomal protein L40E